MVAIRLCLVEIKKHLSTIIMKNNTRTFFKNSRAFFVALTVFTFTYMYSYAQDGNAGINEANMRVRSYFDTGTNLMYAIGAVLGLIGAVKVYQKWNSGDPDTSRVAAAWFGSCIFLVVVATVLKSFFGV